MANISEIEESAGKETIRLLYQYSKSLAEKTKQMMENGEISSAGAQPIILAEEFRNIRPNLPPIMDIFSEFGTVEAGTIGNSALMCAGVYTGGVSASYFRYTNDPIARAYYFASTIFSLSAILNGGMAAIARRCQISETAVVSEALGYGFMRAAKKAHRVGLEVEGKPVPNFLLSKKEIIRLPKFNNGNGAFISPAAVSGVEGISFTQIVLIGTTIFSIYRTAKLVTNGSKRIYKYIKQKSTPKLDPQQSVWFVSEYLIEYFSIDRVYRIYYVALQL